jgi:hypothetical protein
LLRLTDIGLPMIDELSLRGRPNFDLAPSDNGGNPRSYDIRVARDMLSALRADTLSDAWDYRRGRHLSNVVFLKRFAGKPVTGEYVGPWQEHLVIVFAKMLPNVPDGVLTELLDSGAIRPDLENSDPGVAAVYDSLRAIASRDDAAILALPLDRYLAKDSGIDPAVTEYVLAAQMLSAIKVGDRNAMADLLQRNQTYSGSTRFAPTRMLLKAYGLRTFSSNARSTTSAGGEP